MSIRRFQLERYLAGELTGEERRALERLLEVDGEAAATLAALRNEQASFEEKVPYAQFRIEHERRKGAGAATPWWRRGVTLGSSLAAAALALLLVVGLGDEGAEPAGLDTRLKGDGVALSLYVVQPNGEASPGVPGQAVQAGTVLQLVYEASEHRYGALLGVDGAGAVSVYWPSAGDTLAELASGSGRYPFALELDDTAGRERFYAVFANAPLRLAALREVLADAGAGEPIWPRGVAAASSWVEKRPAKP